MIPCILCFDCRVDIVQNATRNYQMYNMLDRNYIKTEGGKYLNPAGTVTTLIGGRSQAVDLVHLQRYEEKESIPPFSS